MTAKLSPDTDLDSLPLSELKRLAGMYLVLMQKDRARSYKRYHSRKEAETQVSVASYFNPPEESSPAPDSASPSATPPQS